MPTHSAGDPAQTSPCGMRPVDAGAGLDHRVVAHVRAGQQGAAAADAGALPDVDRADVQRVRLDPPAREVGAGLDAQSAPSVAQPVIGTVVRRSTFGPTRQPTARAYSAAQRVPASERIPNTRREALARPQLQMDPAPRGWLPGLIADSQQPDAGHDHQHLAGSAQQHEVADDDQSTRAPG